MEKRTTRKRWYRTVNGRLVVLGEAALIVFGLEQLLEARWSSHASRLAVRQLRADDAAADALRNWTALHGALPAICFLLVLAVALVLFLPGHDGRLQRLRRLFL